MGWLRKWARMILDEDLHALDVERDQLRAERDQARELANEAIGGRTYWRKRATQLEESERDQRAAANGAALLRLETELLNQWDRIAAALETQGRDGKGRCDKVELHSRTEAKKMVEQLKRTMYYAEELESYGCFTCPTHPVVGRVFHLRHVKKSKRGRSSFDEDGTRGSSLTESLAERLPEEARTALIQRLALDNGPSSWTPSVADATSPDSTTIMPAVGTVVADGTSETER